MEAYKNLRILYEQICLCDVRHICLLVNLVIWT